MKTSFYTNKKLKGENNRQEIINFLKLNNRWYSSYDLCSILQINVVSIRSHCNNLINQGVVQESLFYKHYPDTIVKQRKIIHYKHYCHRERLFSSEISNGNANKCSS